MDIRRVRNLVSLGIGGLFILGFQNCSDFALRDELLFEQGLIESSRSLDDKILPGLLASTSLQVWSKPGEPQFINKNFSADQWSFIVAADRTAAGVIFRVGSPFGAEASSISVADGKIRAVRANSLGIAYEDSLEVTAPSSGDKMVIAASFGAKASDITLVVNGIVQSGSVVKTGASSDFSFVPKQVESQPTGGQVYEYVVFAGDSLNQTGKLTAEELNVMSRYVANNNMIANVVLDPAILIPGGGTTSSPEFVAAKAIFDGKCIQCHKAGGYSPDLVGLTEAKAVEKGWISKGNPEGSKLYYRLKYSGGTYGPKNMPTDSDISAGDAQVVADWINSIQ